MEKINKLMYEHEREKLMRVSGSIGSEAGVMSIGSGSGIDHILIMATYVNRHEREETIWDISNYLRAEIAKIPHVKYLDVAPSGSTAMASNNLNEVEYPSHSFTRFFIGNDRFLQD
jgi:hypothetical protein